MVHFLLLILITDDFEKDEFIYLKIFLIWKKKIFLI